MPSADAWSSAFTGVGDFYDEEPTPRIRDEPEPDDEFRERLLYVAGDGRDMIERITRAVGARLDEIGEAVGIRRRGVK